MSFSFSGDGGHTRLRASVWNWNQSADSTVSCVFIHTDSALQIHSVKIYRGFSKRHNCAPNSVFWGKDRVMRLDCACVRVGAGQVTLRIKEVELPAVKGNS